MTPSFAITALAASLLIGGPINLAVAQSSANPYAEACGANAANYAVKVVKHNATQPAPQAAPPGKALVYIIESMPDYSIYTKKVNIGMDGTWLGATDAQTHISFTIDPGVHHLCSVYQGEAAPMDPEGQTLLLRLNAQAGHTYYINYHAFFLGKEPGIAFFEPVNDDEGQFLVQRTENVTSTLKKN